MGRRGRGVHIETLTRGNDGSPCTEPGSLRRWGELCTKAPVASELHNFAVQRSVSPIVAQTLRLAVALPVASTHDDEALALIVANRFIARRSCSFCFCVRKRVASSVPICGVKPCTRCILAMLLTTTSPYGRM